MPKMKMHSSKLIAVALAGLTAAAGFAPQAFARPDKDGGQTEGRRQGGKRGGMKMMQQLGLSEAQKAQIKPIMQQAAADTRALRQDTTLSPEVKRARTKAIRAAAQARVQAILTPAQRAQMKQMAAERGMEKMATDLNLTATQKARLSPILSNAKQQREAIQSNASLSPAQKKAQLKSLRETTKSQVDEILTAQQRQQMADAKAAKKQQRGGKGKGRRNRNADNGANGQSGGR